MTHDQRRAQGFLLETKVLDGLFWLARAPRLAGLKLEMIYGDPELRKIEFLVASTLATAARSNERTQMYVARRKYEGVRHREGWGGYLAEVVAHTLSGKAVPFQNVFKTLVADSMKLSSVLITSEVVTYLREKMNERGTAFTISYTTYYYL